MPLPSAITVLRRREVTMPDVRTDKKFRRFWREEHLLIGGGWSVLSLLMVAESWTDGFTRWDPPSMVNGSLVMECILIGAAVAILIFVALPVLETIHITQEEVLCRLGPIVLWRLPFSEIRTVIRTGSPVSDSSAPPKYIPYTEKKFRHLVFSTVEAEELRLRCRGLETKNRDRKGRFRMESRKLATNEEVKRYFKRRLFLLRHRMEWSEDAENALRQRLTTTTFIL